MGTRNKMKFKILTHDNNRWGEGWKFGDIVDMDYEAARVPLENGEIEPFTEEQAKVELEQLEEVKSLAVEENGKPEPEPEEFICDVCRKVCKNKFGLMAHKKSHK